MCHQTNITKILALRGQHTAF